MLRLLLTTFLLWHASGAIAANTELALKQVLRETITIEETRRSSAIEYRPDTSSIRFVLNTPKSLSILHDFAYLTLLGSDQSVVLSRDGRKEAKAQLPAVLARWDKGCKDADQPGRIRCALGKISAKHRIERYFITREQGNKCVVRESLDGKNEISKQQCTRE